jgi:hypothetical protein
MSAQLNPDSRRIIAAQALRAVGYGCTSVLLGALLAARDYTGLLVGVILGCIVAGTAVGSLVFGSRTASAAAAATWPSSSVCPSPAP